MDRPWYLRLDWLLVGACVVLAAIGCIFVHSATLHDPSAHGEPRSQLIFIVVGLALMMWFACIDYRTWRRFAIPLYVLVVGALAFILVHGHSALGAQRWIALGPLTFQPSEPAKLVLAIALAAVLAQFDYARIQALWRPLVVVAIPALLILKQPDLGTTLVIVAILVAELFVGLDNAIDVTIFGGAIFAAAAFVLTSDKLLKPFQRARLLVFLHPEIDPQGVGYNLNQSKIAVGDGGLFGRGLAHGTQTQLAFVPENSRDFIFTALGEEWGFIGAVTLLALYAIVLTRITHAIFSARDRFGVFLGTGLLAMVAFHVIVNVGMTIGIMPITGIPLPFISYGGSAILTDFAAIGIVLNIALQRDRLAFGGSTSGRPLVQTAERRLQPTRR